MPEDLPVVGFLGVISVLLLVTAGLALTGATGVFGTGTTEAPTESTSADPATPNETATPETPTTDGPAFSLATRDVEECGMLCRNVTSTATNEQSVTATNVTIQTRLYAGNDTDGDVRWRRTEQVGTLDPDETYVVTRQVELSLDAALAIREADGWVTIHTTVESEANNVTVTDRQQVG